MRKFSKELSSLRASEVLDESGSSLLTEISSELDAFAKRIRTSNKAASEEVARLSNNVLSTAEAIEDEMASMDDVKAIRAKLEDFEAKRLEWGKELKMAKVGAKPESLAGVLDGIAKRLSNSEKASLDDEGDFDSEDAGVSRKQKAETQLASDLRSALRKLSSRNSALIKRLPSGKAKADHKFEVLRLPIIPVLGRALDARKMALMGVEVIDFEGYPLLDDQMVIAIRTAYARAWGVEPVDVVYDVLDAVSTAAKTKLDLISEDGRSHKERPEWIFYWVMPTTHITKFTSLTGPINDWGLGL